MPLCFVIFPIFTIIFGDYPTPVLNFLFQTKNFTIAFKGGESVGIQSHLVSEWGTPGIIEFGNFLKTPDIWIA